MRGITNDPLRDLMLQNIFEGLTENARINRSLLDRWEKAFKELETRKDLDFTTIQLLESVTQGAPSDELRTRVQDHIALLKSLQC